VLDAIALLHASTSPCVVGSGATGYIEVQILREDRTPVPSDPRPFGSTTMTTIANVTQTSVTTAQQLLATPEDGNRYELIEGVRQMMSPTGGQHGIVAARILRKLGNFVDDHRLGATFAAETGFLLSRDPDTVRAPDAAFVCQRRLDEAGTVTGYWPGAPDLVIEVLSPSDTFSQVESKSLSWLAAGCRMVLVVDPQQKNVTVYESRDHIRVLDNTATVDGKAVVPGWTLSVAEIFD
jgi:Uma2 family endonuclease